FPISNVFDYRIDRSEATSTPRRLGLRPEKRASGGGLTVAAPARVDRTPVHHRLGTGVYRAPGAKRRLRGWARLQRIFRPVAPGWPHRATGSTWPRCEYPVIKDLPTPKVHASYQLGAIRCDFHPQTLW